MSVKVEVTKEAIAQVQRLIQGQPAGTGVRLYLAPGSSEGGCGDGCCGGGGGAALGLAFDTPGPHDVVLPVDGFSILLDETSAPELEGARIDFVERLDASGFTVSLPGRPDAPPIGSGCGCGSGGGCC